MSNERVEQPPSSERVVISKHLHVLDIYNSGVCIGGNGRVHSLQSSIWPPCVPSSQFHRASQARGGKIGAGIDMYNAGLLTVKSLALQAVPRALCRSPSPYVARFATTTGRLSPGGKFEIVDGGISFQPTAGTNAKRRVLYACPILLECYVVLAHASSHNLACRGAASLANITTPI